jgi:hypothetical protein
MLHLDALVEAPINLHVACSCVRKLLGLRNPLKIASFCLQNTTVMSKASQLSKPSIYFMNTRILGTLQSDTAMK